MRWVKSMRLTSIHWHEWTLVLSKLMISLHSYHIFDNWGWIRLIAQAFQIFIKLHIIDHHLGKGLVTKHFEHLLHELFATLLVDLIFLKFSDEPKGLRWQVQCDQGLMHRWTDVVVYRCIVNGDSALYSFRVLSGGAVGDLRAHWVSDHRHLVDLEFIKQPHNVIGHQWVGVFFVVVTASMVSHVDWQAVAILMYVG